MSTYDLEIEQAGGDTTTTAATFVPVRYRTLRPTLRRRAPGSLLVGIPVASHHRPGDFVSGREWRIRRNGTLWQAGIMNAASMPGGERGDTIELKGWGQAIVLLWDVRVRHTYGTGNDADSVIAGELNFGDHGTLGDWFPSAYRTLGSAGTALDPFWVNGVAAIETINGMADVETWEWRPGIDSNGNWTFAASGTVDQDLTGSIKLYSAEAGGNCIITAHNADGDRLITSVEIQVIIPQFRTRLNGSHTAPFSTVTVDTTSGCFPGQTVVIDPDNAQNENRVVNQVTSSTQFTVTTNFSNNHSDNANVEATAPFTALYSSATAADAIRQAHHARLMTINDDSLTDAIRRGAIATATIAAYDHPLHTATVLIPGTEDIKRYLDLSLHPGDRIKLTSAGKLSDYYNDTTVTVQEMTLSVNLDPGPGESTEVVTLQVSDPLLDALQVVERMTRAGRKAASRSFGG